MTIEYRDAEVTPSFVRKDKPPNKSAKTSTFSLGKRVGRAIHLVSDRTVYSIVRQAMTETVVNNDTSALVAARRWAGYGVSGWNMDVRFVVNDPQLSQKKLWLVCCEVLGISPYNTDPVCVLVCRGQRTIRQPPTRLKHLAAEPQCRSLRISAHHSAVKRLYQKTRSFYVRFYISRR